MTQSNNQFLEKVRRRSHYLHQETLKDMNMSETEFTTQSVELHSFVDKLFNGVNSIDEFHSMNDLTKQIVVMAVCRHFSNQLDNYVPTENNPVPASAKHVATFLDQVPPRLALIGLRVEVCIERLITWNLDLLPDFSKIMENVHSSVNKEEK
jgi:hypothetical protein